jgi:choline-sulfatase
MAITRRGFMGISAAAATAALQARAAAPAERYNVVVLIVDEHNPRYSALHGHPLAETPNLRRMMERGTAYLNCYCPSPLCAPSRSSFLSGLRVHQHRHYSNCNSVRQEHPTYAQALSAQGVHPVHAGKADFYLPVGEAGFTEVIRGWDRHPPGDLAISRKPLAVRTGDGAVRARSFGPVDRNPWDDDDTVISDSLAWLKEKAPQLDKPFTLVVNTNAPHFPHWVTPELWEKYAAGADLPAHGVEAASAQHPYAQDLRAHFETHVFTEEQVRGQRRGYLGCVDYADSLAGRFLDLLDTTGLAANTIFIYTSDHGEMLGKFGVWWKSSLYEDSAQVPLVAVGPGIPAGRRVSTPVDLHDVNATLFAATGATRPNAWQGVPLQQIPEDDKGRILFSEYHGHGTRGSAYLIRRGPWKLIWYAEAPHQLFHLDEDPEELHNLAESARPEFRQGKRADGGMDSRAAGVHAGAAGLIPR